MAGSHCQSDWRHTW